MRFLIALAVSIATVSTASATAMAEVNRWRARHGLPELKEVPEATDFAQKKAEYRAARMMKNGHQGPKCPAGWREGCGEADPEWGWLTCVMEEDAVYGGAGVAVGADGERYMVLIVSGGSGRALMPRNNLPTLRTAHLTPNPPRIQFIGRVRKAARQRVYRWRSR